MVSMREEWGGGWERGEKNKVEGCKGRGRMEEEESKGN